MLDLVIRGHFSPFFKFFSRHFDLFFFSDLKFLQRLSKEWLKISVSTLFKKLDTWSKLKLNWSNRRKGGGENILIDNMDFENNNFKANFIWNTIWVIWYESYDMTKWHSDLLPFRALNLWSINQTYSDGSSWLSTSGINGPKSVGTGPWSKHYGPILADQFRANVRVKDKMTDNLAR